MTRETVPAIGRIYLTVAPGADGRMQLGFSRLPPDTEHVLAALVLSGVLMGGAISMDVDLVSDPSLDPDLAGPEGPTGWTPVLVPENDGTRTIIRIADWVRSKVKPAAGYLTAAGTPSAVKADAFNFNQIKRTDIFTAVTASTGIADVAFSPAFATVPAKALPQATNNLLTGVVTAEIVAGSLTKTGCKVKVQQKALLTGILSALAGATVNVIAIEA